MLSSDRPIELSESIRIVKKYRGPVFDIVYGNEDDESALAQFYRNGQAVSSVAPAETASGASARVTQTIANAVGSLYRVAAISESGLVTLDEIDADGNATGNQVQARTFL